MPRHNNRAMSVRERVLAPEGGVETILLDDRYTPYSSQQARIENLCGSFSEYVHTAGLQNVISKVNGQCELFHLHGNVVINQGRGSFLAVRGMHGLECLSRAVNLASPRNVVHMVVLTSKIGKRVQVSSAGLLEACLARQTGVIRVMGRMYEHTNSVGFSILRFDKTPFFMPQEFRPDNNDWTVTGKGMVIIRLIWKSLEWTQACEDACLSMCDQVSDWMRTSC